MSSLRRKQGSYRHVLNKISHCGPSDTELGKVQHDFSMLELKGTLKCKNER